MSAAAPYDDLPAELRAIQAELDGLERREAELHSALEDVEHGMRRCNDALERAGWRSGELEARRRLLMESREAIVADRERLAGRRQELGERLARARERSQGKRDDG